MDGHGKPLGRTNGVGDTDGEGDSALADDMPNQSDTSDVSDGACGALQGGDGAGQPEQSVPPLKQ